MQPIGTLTDILDDGDTPSRGGFAHPAFTVPSSSLPVTTEEQLSSPLGRPDATRPGGDAQPPVVTPRT